MKIYCQHLIKMYLFDGLHFATTLVVQVEQSVRCVCLVSGQ